MAQAPRLALLAAALAAAPAFATAPGQETVWERMMHAQSARLLEEGAQLLEAGRYREAGDVFAKAVVSSPNDATAHMMLGVAHYWSGDVGRAMLEYEQALKLDPKDAQAHQLMGIAHAWKGDVQEAHRRFQEAARLAPDRADVHMNLGSTIEALGDLSGALTHFRHAIQLQPGHPLYHHQLGVLYARLGRDEEARGALEQSIRLYGRYQDSLLELGALEERLGRLKEAADLFRRAVKNKPADAVARFRLASAQWRLGRRDDARKALEGAFRVSPLEKGGRLALSTAYAGSKPPPAGAAGPEAAEPPKPDPADPVESLKRNLRRLPKDRTAKVEAQLVYLPNPELKTRKREGDRLKRALEGGPNPIAVKREFSLPAGDPEGRERQIEAVAGDLASALKSRPAGQVHIGLNVRYEDPFQEDPRVAYEPRPGDNEMGLWVVGTTWVELVKESLDALPGEGAALVKGAGWLTLGEAARAAAEFQAAAEVSPKDPLPRLGLAVARVVEGRESEAVEGFKAVLELDPKNDAAAAALKWLAIDDQAKTAP